MATEALQIDALWSGLNNPTNGKSYSGAIVATFAADGSTPKAVWEDKEKTAPTVAGKSQFVLDSNGQAEVFGDGVYVIKVYAPSDTGLTSPLMTFDGLTYINNELLVSEAFDVDHNPDYTHIVFESIADFKSSTLTPFENQKVSLLGYTVPGDGADGDFVWDPSDLSTEVALDTQSGIYVAQANISATGSLGAWVRDNITDLNVKWFMGSPDGTTDNSSAFEGSEDMRELFPTRIYVPGDINPYMVSNIAILDNYYIYGDGVENTIIEFYQDSVSSRQMFHAISTNVSTDVDDNNKNFTFRDIKFLGTSVADGFSEFRHMLLFKGVSNVLVDSCHFEAFQGDAIVFQSVNEYNNEYITITNNIFDGVNQANRNAISIQSANQLLIDNNIFRNTTASNMPGAIDFEPNSGYIWSVLDSITISNNTFNNIGGNIGAVGWNILINTTDFTTPPKDLTIINNDFKDVYRGIYVNQYNDANPDETTDSFNLKMIGNTITDATDFSFWVFGVKDAEISGNLFDGSPIASRIGWTITTAVKWGCYNVNMYNNIFRNCATDSTVENVIQLYNSNRVSFIKETYDTCGAGTSISYAVYLSTGVMSYIDMIRCTTVNSTFSGMISRNNGTTTVDAITNTLIGNKPGSGTALINDNVPANYQIDDKMVIKSGLGVGNSAAATTLGSVTDKMEVFDAAGASIGFVPIYDAITP